MRVGKLPLSLATRVDNICRDVIGDTVDALSRQKDDLRDTYALRRCLLQQVRQPGQAGELFSHGVAGRSAQPLSFDWRMP